ncbi:hypothetical protein GCM10010136_05860 [Limoniibacter endophyticus]|uniref:Uncharacterized protein n=1 Tax=Limoniibacter endophyticus TaxID=1565040 RepID=A0A8J3GGC9_9HYPH|nr:hypothetical protein GCM10010136_05860 [Limoniibacter endophyticus]
MIDVLPLADETGNGAETAGNPHRADIGEGRHRLVEHARVEFERLAVHVEISAGKVGHHQRSAGQFCRSVKLVHITIFGSPDLASVEAGEVKETLRIMTTAMG